MTRRRLFRGLLLAALMAPVVVAGGQTIPTNGAAPGPRTGMIVGQVVDATTGTSIPEAIVLINLPRYMSPHYRVMADAEGRFFFPDLPAGDYYLEASIPGYVAGDYGQQKPMGQYQLLTLAEGEQRADVKLRVWKYAVISGTVLDEAGEPVVGVSVRALGRTIFGGRVQYGTTQVRDDLVPTAVTDDRGMFRLSQLMAGSYLIVVPSTQNSVPVEFVDGQNNAVRGEMAIAGISETSPVGLPGVLEFGGVALLGSSRMQVPPAVSPAGRMQVYRTTFHPSATTAAEASPIAVGTGEERSGIAITLRPAAAVRVSGRVVTPDGSVPPPMGLYLSGEASRDLVVRRPPANNGNFDTAVAITDRAGRFTFLGVPAGEYVVQQSSPFLSRALQTGVATFWVDQSLTVAATDMNDVIVQLRPALRVAGRFEFHSTAAPEKPPSIGINFQSPYGASGFATTIRPDGDLTFQMLGAGGPYLIRPNELGGWFVQSVTVGGKDYTDRVFDLREDTSSIVVTFTDRPNRITGTVKNARGVTSSTAQVLAFPVDRQRWTGYGRDPRELVSAVTSTAGAYVIPHLPPGEYFVIAVESGDAENWLDPKVLEQLSARARKMTIGSTGAQQTVDLTVTAIR